jgi:hypothetical protein
MKQVRYAVGAVCLGPMALGMATAAGTAQTADAATGHVKTVSLHTVVGHPAAATLAAAAPDLKRVGCSRAGDWLKIYQNSSTHVDCFANAGSQSVRIYNIDFAYTGNNGYSAILYRPGHDYYCYQSRKNTVVYASSCKSIYGGRAPWNETSMIYLRIFPGVG